jgi:hypothetical protein
MPACARQRFTQRCDTCRPACARVLLLHLVKERPTYVLDSTSSGLSPRSRSAVCRSCFARLSFGPPRRSRFAAMQSRFRRSGSWAPSSKDIGMGRGAGSALLFARARVHASSTRDFSPSPRTGVGHTPFTHRSRAATRRDSACRRPAAPASASVGAAAEMARLARPLPGGRPAARPSESRTWRTRCSSTPPTRRRRVLL